MTDERQSILLNDPDRYGNIEAMMDYILAWTFKMCDEKNHKNNINMELLSECRKILSKLIGFDVSTEDFSVSTYLEWKKIDLVVEITFTNGSNYVFLIENKVHSSLPEWQLSNNKIIFKEHYDKEEELKWKQSYLLICATNVNTEMKQQCIKDGYKYYTLEELTDYCADDTGNAIFDEFWRRDWGE